MRDRTRRVQAVGLACEREKMKGVRYYLAAWVRWQREAKDLIIACPMLPWLVVLIVLAWK